MTKKKKFYYVAIVFYLFAVVMLGKGIDKMTNYNSGDSYYSDPVNAYVGGDAYNYIINGTYATAFFVLTAAGLISGTICVGIGVLQNELAERHLADKDIKSSNINNKVVLPEL